MQLRGHSHLASSERTSVGESSAVARTTFDGENDVSGNFALDSHTGRVRLAATDSQGVRVILALNIGKAVAVKIQNLGQYPRVMCS